MPGRNVNVRPSLRDRVADLTFVFRTLDLRPVCGTERDRRHVHEAILSWAAWRGPCQAQSTIFQYESFRTTFPSRNS